MSFDGAREDLEAEWKSIYQKRLPSLARSKDSSQKKWLIFWKKSSQPVASFNVIAYGPSDHRKAVQLDHCFARIILDAVVGRGEDFGPSQVPTQDEDASDPTPWTAKLKSPAIKNIDSNSLANCINLGKAIASGDVDLVQLDELSLKHRGKGSKVSGVGQKRKSDKVESLPTSRPKKGRQDRSDKDIRAALGAKVPSPAPAVVDTELNSLVQGSDLTEFRKRVLLALCQVPRGSVSTYLAISDFLKSSPRAVGNALRNNPFAPRAPCHRIVAADHSIGGFGGSWGTQGAHFKEKVALLEKEGVKVDAQGKVKAEIWTNFQWSLGMYDMSSRLESGLF